MGIMNRIALLCPMKVMDKRERIPDGVQLFVYSAEHSAQAVWESVQHIASGAFGPDGGIVSLPSREWEGMWNDQFFERAATQVWRLTDEVGVHMPSDTMRVYGTGYHVLPRPHVCPTALYTVLADECLHVLKDPLLNTLGFQIIEGSSLTEVLNALIPQERVYSMEEEKAGLAV